MNNLELLYGDLPKCPRCGGEAPIGIGLDKKRLAWRCQDCKRLFFTEKKNVRN